VAHDVAGVPTQPPPNSHNKWLRDAITMAIDFSDLQQGIPVRHAPAFVPPPSPSSSLKPSPSGSDDGDSSHVAPGRKRAPTHSSTKRLDRKVSQETNSTHGGARPSSPSRVLGTLPSLCNGNLAQNSVSEAVAATETLVGANQSGTAEGSPSENGMVTGRGASFHSTEALSFVEAVSVIRRASAMAERVASTEREASIALMLNPEVFEDLAASFGEAADALQWLGRAESPAAGPVESATEAARPASSGDSGRGQAPELQGEAELCKVRAAVV
jgi:hypothetical protein